MEGSKRQRRTEDNSAFALTAFVDTEFTRNVNPWCAMIV
jgi:hypothetical protein